MIPHTLEGELLRRKARTDYGTYVELANPGFYMTHFHRYLCDEIQRFLEAPCTNGAMDILMISVPPQHGKAVGKDVPVFTPDGWRKHGDLQVGDAVYGADGSIQYVIQVHPDYYCKGWRIEFSTGEVVEQLSPQHLWNVCYTDRSHKPAITVKKLVETRDIFNQDSCLLERAPYIEVNGPLQGTSVALPIDPYLLGLWLGDGYSHTGTLCGAVEDLHTILPDYPITIQNDIGIVTNLIDNSLLRAHNLIKNKHIPAIYLIASIEQRRQLLYGLFDTDGNISRNNCVAEITLSNYQLAKDVYTLIRSLGYKAQISKRITHSQDTSFEGVAYRVKFRPHDGDILFKLPRKQAILDTWSAKHKESPRSSRYYITDVFPCDDILCNCISVTGDGTYLVGEDLIPTHNSHTVTETLPSWYLAKHPQDAVIIAGYESTFAESFNRRNRDKFNGIAQEVFLQQARDGSYIHDCRPNLSAQNVAQWETMQGGKCRAAGLKAGITGHGAELFIIDDPIKNKEQADSETVIAKIHDEMGPSVQSRIHPGGKLIVIQTRWVENDVIGWILTNWAEYVYKYINLPAEYDKEAADIGPDPLGRSIGDSLMGAHLGDDETKLPAKIANTNKWLAAKKQLVIASDGSRTWNALYQGRPSAADGNLFNPSWWTPYYRTSELRASLEYIQMTVDATFKNTETSDYVSIMILAVKGRDVYLWKLINKRMTFTDTVAKIKSIVADFPDIDELVIEDKANGSAIIDVLRYDVTMPAIVAVNPQGGKFSRAQSIAPFVSTGAYHVPLDFTASEQEDVEWDNKGEGLNARDKFIKQHTTFPFGRHDDMVDANSQGLSRIIKIITGEIKPAKHKSSIRYTKWREDMWEDYNALKTDEDREAYFRAFGYPEEWEDEEDIDYQTSIRKYC